MANAQRKLSKRKGDPSFEDLLNEGYLTEAIINYLVLLGWSPRGEREFYTLKELEEHFDTDDLKLEFLQRYGWLIDDDEVRAYSAKFKPNR